MKIAIRIAVLTALLIGIALVGNAQTIQTSAGDSVIVMASGSTTADGIRHHVLKDCELSRVSGHDCDYRLFRNFRWRKRYDLRLESCRSRPFARSD